MFRGYKVRDLTKSSISQTHGGLQNNNKKMSNDFNR
ncbi:hypothetical protein Golob_020245 [Gossypium lobatum]|uniref:Uncharacterized protein n=1 Tax=Gossypium lobatum TaxID=34289 RepID=A0A7J8L9S5_9ROSI|nr:hypothetical protein [Gossypium lobatum]